MALTEVEKPLTVGDIQAYLRCPYSSYLDEQVRRSSIPMSGFEAQHYWLMNALKKLFPVERHVGPDLVDIESLRGEELADYLRFHSPEAFANATGESWRRYMIDENGRIHGRNVVWSYSNQWYKAKIEIEQACANFYRMLLEEGPPVLSFTHVRANFSHEVAFHHGKRKHVTRLGFIRKGHVIGEYGIRQASQEDIDGDFEITLDLLAFCTLAHEEEARRIKWGVDPEKAERWGSAGMYIAPEVRFRYYDLLQNLMLETTRSDADIPEMLGTIEEVEQGTRQREFKPHPSHRNCSACSYNVVTYVNPICGEKKSNVRTMKPMGALKDEAARKKAELIEARKSPKT